MKYKEFKETLDKQFADDDEIFPHAGTSTVVFARSWHGQDYFRIEKMAERAARIPGISPRSTSSGVT